MHIPVLQKEVLELLNPKPNENFIDCTLNEGGHSILILEKTGPKGKILGIDWDQEALEKVRKGKPEFKKRLILENDNFSNLTEIVKKNRFNSVSGILFDLGMSSWQLEESGRGFTFLKKEPLDMRFNPNNPLTASKILNYWSEAEIERIVREYGEEKFSSQIAKEIIKTRRVGSIENTVQLVEIIKKAVPFKLQHQNIHFATRTFQALRIAANDELMNLEKALPQALDVLKEEGKILVISFHSLEDRIVKNFFKNKSFAGELKIIAKKPIEPGLKEIKENPRSRSAKLRAGIKMSKKNE